MLHKWVLLFLLGFWRGKNWHFMKIKIPVATILTGGSNHIAYFSAVFKKNKRQ